MLVHLHHALHIASESDDDCIADIRRHEMTMLARLAARADISRRGAIYSRRAPRAIIIARMRRIWLR